MFHYSIMIAICTNFFNIKDSLRCQIVYLRKRLSQFHDQRWLFPHLTSADWSAVWSWINWILNLIWCPKRNRKCLRTYNLAKCAFRLNMTILSVAVSPSPFQILNQFFILRRRWRQPKRIHYQFCWVSKKTIAVARTCELALTLATLTSWSSKCLWQYSLKNSTAYWR